ncbi:MAG: lytic transglycosylase domain-containing protein [Alphaproteobacteria bacterium]|nr:lytic transglycosylase domain-containing protein [Alphaproteobacteria bacterium]
MVSRAARVFIIAVSCAVSLASDTSFAAPSSFVRVLSDDDVANYKKLFAAAAAGDKDQIAAIAPLIKNRSLMGHVTARGYLSPSTVAEFGDLKAWLKKYDDYPEAARIYALAVRKDPKRAGELEDPDRRIIRGNSDESEGGVDFTSPAAETAAKKLKSLIAGGKLEAATTYLESAELRGQLPRGDYGRLAHQVAAGQYYLGDSKSALALADRVSDSVRSEVPDADWIAGLAAFRLNKFDLAAKHFAALAENPASSSWMKSAAGFWAARSYLIAKQPEKFSRMLEIAADKPRTFYGLIALRLLGRDPPFSWNEPSLDKAGFQRMMKVNGIERGVALYQCGEMEAAEGSLARSHGRLNPELDRPFIALAHEMGFAHVQLLAAGAAKAPDLKAAAYPVMSVKPSDGWQVDPALVHAIVRQESKFEMRVTSSSDARGLMQLLPSTAAGTMKDTTLDNPGTKAKLFDPAFNLSVGQRYVKKMFEFAEPDGNLFHIVVAYNGGPGNLQKWLREVEHRGDPLLFIESIPSRETRGYVERVVANFWIYQDRLGETKTTLDQVARGEWPVVKWSEHQRVAELRR